MNKENQLLSALGMPHGVTFQFSPLQYVKVSLYGLQYDGRVIRCIHESGGILYDVDYAHNGELRRREFYEDELSALPLGRKKKEGV